LPKLQLGERDLLAFGPFYRTHDKFSSPCCDFEQLEARETETTEKKIGNLHLDSRKLKYLLLFPPRFASKNNKSIKAPLSARVLVGFVYF
jgi:hypothetical protein